MIQPRLKLTAAALALVLAVPAFAAPERRRVASPAGDVPPTLATINGTVTDIDTGAPVVNADSSDAKCTHALAMYSGKPIFAIGCKVGATSSSAD
ncbi:MAG: hypothetical protein ABI837_13230, partial [Acidobacteriota bacterium]